MHEVLTWVDLVDLENRIGTSPPLYYITTPRIAKTYRYMESVRAVKPWAVFRVTDAGVVELDTGDVIQ